MSKKSIIDFIYFVFIPTLSVTQHSRSQTMKWQPEQYNQFLAQRRQPFDVLMTMVRPKPSMRIVDLGCGTGALTVDLHEHFDALSTLGVDNSAEMLSQSAQHQRPRLSFVHQDIRTFEPAGRFDLIFSNATLQWVPEPRRVIARLVEGLPSGGQLAVQVPCQDDYFSYDIARQLATSSPFQDALGGWVRKTHALGVREYATLLNQLGMQDVHCRVQVFNHHLPDAQALLSWLEGSLLRAYAARMSPSMFEQFRQTYLEKLYEHVPSGQSVYYPFTRILFVATKP